MRFLLEPMSIKLRLTSCGQLLNDMIIIQSFVLQVRASQSVALLSFYTLQFICVDKMLSSLERPSQMLEGLCSVITTVNRKSFKLSMRKCGMSDCIALCVYRGMRAIIVTPF